MRCQTAELPAVLACDITGVTDRQLMVHHFLHYSVPTQWSARHPDGLSLAGIPTNPVETNRQLMTVRFRADSTPMLQDAVVVLCCEKLKVNPEHELLVEHLYARLRVESSAVILEMHSQQE